MRVAPVPVLTRRPYQQRPNLLIPLVHKMPEGQAAGEVLIRALTGLACLAADC